MSTPSPPDPMTVPWRPTVDDVAALLRARTKDASGQEIGTFTDATRPTDAEVEQLITNGCAKVAALVGWDIPAEAWPEALHLASLVAACEVELSYFPEQVRNDRSAFAQLWQLYTADVQAFVDYVEAISPPGTIGAGMGSIPALSSTVDFAYRFGLGGLAGPMSDTVNVGLGGGGSRRRR